MAIIDKKFIHFKNYDDFVSQAGVGSVDNITTPTSGSEDTRDAVYGQIKGSSIVFIKDTKQIWTHGQLYSCNVDASHALWADENNVVNRENLLINGTRANTTYSYGNSEDGLMFVDTYTFEGNTMLNSISLNGANGINLQSLAVNNPNLEEATSGKMSLLSISDGQVTYEGLQRKPGEEISPVGTFVMDPSTFAYSAYNMNTTTGNMDPVGGLVICDSHTLLAHKSSETMHSLLINDDGVFVDEKKVCFEILNVTYSELKNLRDSAKLIPGAMYRLTDYECTTSQGNTASAGHKFDIILTALSNNTLDEEAYAMCSERDTDNYFGTSELNAWKLWYCLDNDRERFGWADTTNGKGVIYRMIDENGNDCPYDFKNIVYVTECKGYTINEDIATALSNSTIDDPYFIEVDYWFVSDNAASGTYGSKDEDIIVRLEMGTNPDGKEVPVVYKTERKGIVATWDDEAQEYILDEDYTNPDYSDAFYHVGRYTYNDIEYDMWRKAEMSAGEMVWLKQESGGDSHILTEILTQESEAPYQYKYTFNQVLDISSPTIDEQVLDLSTAHKRLPCDKQFQMYGNTIAPSHYDMSTDTYSSATWLNANIINVTSDWNNPYVSYELYYNTFGPDSCDNTITIGSGAVYIMNNYIGPNCFCNKFYGDGGEGICDNHLEISSMCVFKLNASYNILHQCHDVTFGEYLGSGTFSIVTDSKIGNFTYNSRISNSTNISYKGDNIVINNGFNIDISTDIFCRNLSINNSGNFTLVSNADLNSIDINNLTLEDTTPKHTIVIPGTGVYPLKVAQNSRGEIKIYNEADLIA